MYALGAILYECLTGRPPFQSATVLDTLALVRTREPLQQSRVQPAVPRDLETICLRCLQKEPGKRYAGAEELAEDLRRFQAGEPIRARPVPPWERARKWARRRPALAALIGISLLAAAVLAGATTVYTVSLRAAVRREQAERQRAQDHLRLANDAIQHMLTDLGGVQLEHAPELQEVREQMLLDARTLYDAMLNEPGGADPETRFQQARTYCLLGNLQVSLGRVDEAEVSYREGLSLLRQLVAEHPGVVKYRDVWLSERARAAGLLVENGRGGEAQADLNEVVRLAEHIDAAGANVRATLAIAYTELANAGAPQGEEYRLKAVALDQDAVHDEPDNAARRVHLATAQHNLGLLYYHTGRPAQAEVALRRAVETWQQLRGTRSIARRSVLPGLAESTMLLAYLREPVRRDEALDLARRAVAIREELVQKYPTVPGYGEALARARHTLADFCVKADRWQEAEALEGQAVAYRERQAEPAPAGSPALVFLAQNLIALGVIQGHLGSPARGEATLRRAVALAEEGVRRGPDPDEARGTLAAALIDLSDLLLPQTGRAADALASARQAVVTLEPLCRRRPGESTFRGYLLNALGNRALALGRLGKPAEALADWDRLVEMAGEADRVRFRFPRAVELARAGAWDRALDEARRLEQEKGLSGQDLYNLACVHALAGARPERAEEEAAYAVRVLTRLARDGYLKSPATLNQLKTDDDLRLLRQRPDFRRLLEGLEKPPK